jgi:hypothetical protein
MASRDIVHQMTDEMGMNQQMLQNMQQQQMSQMPMPAGGMQPPAAVDFGQLSPEQQMMMMQQSAVVQPPPFQGGPPMPPQPPMAPPQAHQREYDDSSSISSSSSGSGSVNLEKLGLGVSSNRGWFESILNYLRDPLFVVVIFVIMSLPWMDSVLKPIIPYGLAYGTYFIGIKGVLAGLLYFLVKLVV